MDFKPIFFKRDSVSYIVPSWNQLADLTFELSKKILETEAKFDRIITLAKGGWPLACSLVDFLAVKYVASLGIKFYSGVYQMLDKPEIYQDLPKVIKGEKVLLFDDVADSGKSFEFARKYLKKRKVKSVTTVSLFYKPHSQFEPDYWVSQTNAWIVFPYDVREMIGLLGQRWQKQGIEKEQIINRFKQLNFDQNYLGYFYK